MIADDEEAAAGTMTARPPGADEVRTACDRPGRKAASTAPRGMARTRSRAAAGRPASDAATTLPTGVDGAARPASWAPPHAPAMARRRLFALPLLTVRRDPNEHYFYFIPARSRPAARRWPNEHYFYFMTAGPRPPFNGIGQPRRAAPTAARRPEFALPRPAVRGMPQ